MPPDALLAILRVPKDQRVRCQAPGCRQAVYQSIHVVRLNGAVTIYGSECFKTHFLGHVLGGVAPVYSTVTNKLLTDAERAMLDNNTALLLEHLHGLHAENLSLVAAQRPVRSRLAQSPTHSRIVASLPETETTDPVLLALIRAREQGMSRSQMLADRGLKLGDSGFYDFSLLLAKAGFRF